MKKRPHRIHPYATLIAIVTLSVGCIAGCGGDTKTVTITTSTPAPSSSTAVLTEPQAIVAADGICASAIRRLEPMVRKLETIERSSKGKAAALASAPLLEHIGGQTRDASRELEHLMVKPNSFVLYYRATLHELAIIEEQLSQARLENERQRIKPIINTIQELKTHAQHQAEQAYLKTCSKIQKNPVG
jgi:hypothetical protein